MALQRFHNLVPGTSNNGVSSVSTMLAGFLGAGSTYLKGIKAVALGTSLDIQTCRLFAPNNHAKFSPRLLRTDPFEKSLFHNMALINVVTFPRMP